MIQKTETYNQKSVFNSFNNINYLRKGYIKRYRNHSAYEVEMNTKVNSAFGAIWGTLIPMIILGKIQKKNLFKIDYGLKEMLVVAAGSIIGGVIGGVESDKSAKKEKINEGVFQFMNAAIPAALVEGLTKWTKNIESMQKIPTKIATTLGAVGVGMFAAAKISNLICDPYDKVPDRKLSMKDSIANIDDAIGAFIIAKIPHVEKLKGIIPAVYAWCGYRAGKAN